MMKRALTHALTILALIMTFSLAAYADHGHVARSGGTDATNVAATQAAAGHTGLREDGHLN